MPASSFLYVPHDSLQFSRCCTSHRWLEGGNFSLSGLGVKNALYPAIFSISLTISSAYNGILNPNVLP